MYLYPVYQIADGIIHQIRVHLKDVLFVLGGGAGQSDMPQVGKFHLGAVFPFAKIGNQPFCGIKLGLSVSSGSSSKHFLCTRCHGQVFFLLVFHPFPHHGYRLTAEDGKAGASRKGIIPQTDAARSVIDLIDGKGAPILFQLHPKRDKISHFQIFDNLIPAVLQLANGDVMAMKLQLLCQMGPAQVGAGDGSFPKTGNVLNHSL